MMADQQQQQPQQQAPPQQPQQQQAASSTQQPSQQQQQQQHPVTPVTPQPTPPTQHQLAPQQHQHQQHQQQQNSAAVSSLASSIAMNTMAITMPNNIGIAQQGAVASIRSPLPQVQVIHQAMHSPSYLPQFSYNQQQQLMLQNAAMQAAMQASGMNINPQQLNLANMAVAMQGRPNSNMTATQGMLTHSPTQVQPGTPMISSPPTSQAYNVQATNANNKTGAIMGNGNKMPSQATQQQMQQAQQAQVAQATAMVGKTVMSNQPNPPPLLIGQLGVLPGHLTTNQTFGPHVNLLSCLV